MFTHYYTAILLAYGEQWKEAKKELLIAQEKGLSQEEVDRILNLGINNEILKINAVFYFGLIVAVWALGLLLLFFVGKLFLSDKYL